MKQTHNYYYCVLGFIYYQGGIMANISLRQSLKQSKKSGKQLRTQYSIQKEHKVIQSYVQVASEGWKKQ